MQAPRAERWPQIAVGATTAQPLHPPTVRGSLVTMNDHPAGQAPSAAEPRMREAADEAVWGCRLAAARIRFPTYVPGLEKYHDGGRGAHVWTHDWYAHVLFAHRLLDAAQNLERHADVDGLADAVDEFTRHWATLRGLRNVLQHPLNRSLNPKDLWVFRDRIEHRHPGCDVTWRFTIDELHDPVEALYDQFAATT